MSRTQRVRYDLDIGSIHSLSEDDAVRNFMMMSNDSHALRDYLVGHVPKNIEVCKIWV